MNTHKHRPFLSDEHVEDDMADLMITAPDWRDLITAPMEENCLAPSDEALGLAFDRYCDVLHAPFHESEAEMAAVYADIVGGIADLQIIVPDLLEEILSPEQEEHL